jgi:hypothetical protein
MWTVNHQTDITANNRASATPGAANVSEQPEDQVKQEEPDVSNCAQEVAER